MIYCIKFSNHTRKIMVSWRIFPLQNGMRDHSQNPKISALLGNWQQFLQVMETSGQLMQYHKFQLFWRRLAKVLLFNTIILFLYSYIQNCIRGQTFCTALFCLNKYLLNKFQGSSVYVGFNRWPNILFTTCNAGSEIITWTSLIKLLTR